MSSFLDDAEAAQQRQAEERKRAHMEAKQFRADVQAMFEAPAGRRVLAAFLATAGVDMSPLRASVQDTGHAIGWQDAGGWWLNLLRQHCPEREGQMRKEQREAARIASQDTENDERDE